MVSKVP